MTVLHEAHDQYLEGVIIDLTVDIDRLKVCATCSHVDYPFYGRLGCKLRREVVDIHDRCHREWFDGVSHWKPFSPLSIERG